MKPSRRGISLALAFVAVFAIGFLLSAYLLFLVPLYRASAVLNYYSMLGQLDTYIYMQCQMGTSSSCESALKHYIAKLDTVRNEDGGRMPEIVSKVIVAKTRLAFIAEQHGNPAEAENFFAAAIAQCPIAFKHPCSIEHLRKIVLATSRDNPLRLGGAQPVAPPDPPKSALLPAR